MKKQNGSGRKVGQKNVREVDGKKVEFEVVKVETTEDGFLIVTETGKEIEE